MKILVVSAPWIGGLFDSLANALKNNGHDVLQLHYKRQKSALRLIKIHNIPQIHNMLEKKSWRKFNDKVLLNFKIFKPDLFISMNQSYLLPETVKIIQNNNCRTINFVADNPFDSHRYSYFPITLKYYNEILVHDKIWIPSIKNVAPKSRIIKIISGGGFNKDLFYPVEEKDINNDDRTRLSCDVSFTGESYGMNAEGGYRAGILDHLGDYNLKIWGDDGWKLRFPYYNNLESAYKGGRLPYEDLRKLYHLCKINLNMPSPQVFTGFQPRLFEIAACKGFQIVDWREELDEYFSDDEIVTFKDIPDLKDKIRYYLNHPKERNQKIEKLYRKVVENFTWQKQIKNILDIINE